MLLLAACGQDGSPGASGGRERDAVSATDCSIAAGQSASNNNQNCTKNIIVVTDESIAKIIKEMNEEQSALKKRNLELQRTLSALQANQRVTRDQLIYALREAQVDLDEGKSPAQRFTYVIGRFKHLQKLAATSSADGPASSALKRQAQAMLRAGDLDGAQAKIADLELQKTMHPVQGPPPGLHSPTAARFDGPDDVRISANAWLRNQYGNWINIAEDDKAVKLITFGQLKSQCPQSFSTLLNSLINFGKIFDLQSYYVTVASEDDTQKVLHQFSKENAIPIQILRGERVRIDYIAKNLAAYYRKEPSGYYAMSTTIYVLDRRGKFVAALGPDDPVHYLADALKKAEESSRAGARPGISAAAWDPFVPAAHASAGSEVPSTDISQAMADFSKYRVARPRPCRKHPH
ncbi:SCO family protein [Sphingomonas koreensis]